MGRPRTFTDGVSFPVVLVLPREQRDRIRRIFSREGVEFAAVCREALLRKADALEGKLAKRGA